MDGVCIDFLTPFLARINHHSGNQFKLEDMRTWNMYDSFDVPSDVRELVDSDIHTRGYCLNLEPLPGAIEGVELLKAIADIYVVTSPWTSHPTWEYERRNWVKHHLGIDKNHIISTSAKYVCAGQILIDDKIETLKK